MDFIKRTIIILGIIITATACSNVKQTDRADPDKAVNKPMRERYDDSKRDNTPGHQNRDNQLNHTK